MSEDEELRNIFNYEEKNDRNDKKGFHKKYDKSRII